MYTTSWIVEVVQVSSRRTQQEVLERLQGFAGLTASGVSLGHDHFVVLGVLDNLMKSAAEVLIADIDPDAVCSYISCTAQRSYTTPTVGSLN